MSISKGNAVTEAQSLKLTKPYAVHHVVTNASSRPRAGGSVVVRWYQVDSNFEAQSLARQFTELYQSTRFMKRGATSVSTIYQVKTPITLSADQAKDPSKVKGLTNLSAPVATKAPELAAPAAPSESSKKRKPSRERQTSRSRAMSASL